MVKTLLLAIATAATILFSTQAVMAQWAPITFDPGDTLWPHAISIDTINYHHNIWEVGAPHKTIFTSALSLPNVIVTDTVNPYPSNDTSVFTFTFPGNATYPGTSYLYWIVEVRMNYQLNIDSSTIVKIEFSPDSGATWINLQDSTPIGIDYIAPLSQTTDWSEWWMNFSDLTYYHNDSLKLKFTFISGNDSSGKDGWMMDNIIVAYGTENVPRVQNNNTFAIYPNPANTFLTVSSKNRIASISIINLLGQTVYYQQSDSEKLKIDVDIANLPNSMYFIKINGDEVQRFMKE